MTVGLVFSIYIGDGDDDDNNDDNAYVDGEYDDDDDDDNDDDDDDDVDDHGGVTLVETDENEYRLIRDLLTGYDKRVRPSHNYSESLNVTFGLALAQIIDVVT
nr:hypothetical protein BaRGS_011230 [Batillaria attramentaria]